MHPDLQRSLAVRASPYRRYCTSKSPGQVKLLDLMNVLTGMIDLGEARWQTC